MSHQLTLPMLSKTICSDGEYSEGINVATHCKITGYVAQELLNTFPDFIRVELFPESAAFLAACHDIGKISPVFQRVIYNKIYGTVEAPQKFPELENVRWENYSRNSEVFHANITKYLFKDKYLKFIEGWHHGFAPKDACETPFSERCSSFGGQLWSFERHELLAEIRQEFLADRNALNPKIHSWDEATLLGGLVITADWIASGGSFAELPLNHGKSDEELKQMAREAVLKAGFSPLSIIPGLSFEDIFQFFPRKIQEDLFNRVTGPGVYVLEAPMGMGKTEAALYAAYRMLAEGKAAGIYFGLPTQLTSNKIYERVDVFLNHILSQKTGAAVPLRLLHGAAWLEDTHSMGGDAEAGGSWFDGRKRGILAPFAVGTIDQALMAVLNVRHGTVRDFGLAGKVVILDEVHSYDTYTGTLLNELVSRLRALKCTVIILSATLTDAQKREILKLDDSAVLDADYPLITSLKDKGSAGAALHQLASEQGTPHTVLVERCTEDEQAICMAIERAEAGDQVLWIENTVGDAQDIFKVLAARCSGCDIECGLLHSRFLQCDREKNETSWVGIYGKQGKDKRQTKGRILVGTQVLEQSIDIDADLLVCRLCPSDMILQRMGRLWRHENNPRPKGAARKTILLAPNYADALKKPGCFGKSSYIYDEYVLLRTLEVWENRNQAVLPKDIRTILEATYCPREDEPDKRLYELKVKLYKEKDRLKSLALAGTSKLDQTQSDDSPPTRYSETETVSLILFRNFHITKDGCEFRFVGDNQKYCISQNRPTLAEKRHLAKLLMRNTVRLNVYKTNQEEGTPAFHQSLKNFFSNYLYLGDDRERPVRAAVLDDGGQLRTLDEDLITIRKKSAFYDSHQGYRLSSME